MIQYIILGYLIYEILRLAQLPDVSAVKFVPPPPEQAPPPPSSESGQNGAAPPIQSPEAPKSEEATTAKSG